MVHQGLLRNKVFLGMLLLMLACREKEHIFLRNVNENSSNHWYSGGFLYVDSIPLSGCFYQLYPNNKDTLSIKRFQLGKEHGNWKQFYANGSLKSNRFYEKGKKENNYDAWWPNGKKQLEYHFKNDVYEGVCREWNPKGLLVKEMHYHKGQEEGSQKVWYDNGKLKSNYVIKKGRRYGLLGTKNCNNVSDSILP